KGRPAPAGSPILRVAPVAPVDRPAPTPPTDSAREVEHRPSSSGSPPTRPSPSRVPSPSGEAAPMPRVSDLATLARGGTPEPSLDGDRLRTNDKFRAEHPAPPD